MTPPTRPPKASQAASSAGQARPIKPPPPPAPPKADNAPLSRQNRLLKIAVAVLAVLLLAAGFLWYQEYSANRAAQAESARMLNRFLASDRGAGKSTHEVPIRLENVKFHWSDKVFIDSGNMAIHAVPITGSVVNFDNPQSFVLNMQQSKILIRPSVLEGMFNESVFNYPGSKLRNLKVAIVRQAQKNYVELTGNLDYIFWLPFRMLTEMRVDKASNTLVISVKEVRLLGVIPATRLIEFRPFHLERLMSLPANKHLSVKRNEIMVKPFGLFPPPRINGTIDQIQVNENLIMLGFAGKTIAVPQQDGRNYIYIGNGHTQFGRFQMRPAQILVKDQDPSDPFVFSLANYQAMIPKSQITVKDLNSATVTMPDWR